MFGLGLYSNVSGLGPSMRRNTITSIQRTDLRRIARRRRGCWRRCGRNPGKHIKSTGNIPGAYQFEFARLINDPIPRNDAVLPEVVEAYFLRGRAEPGAAPFH